MKKLLLAVALLWAAGGAGYWYWNEMRSQRVAFRTVAVRRGDLMTTVSASGTIEPEEVVDVGAQIAGIIKSFGIDPHDASKPISYGCLVEEGTVLAQLDDALFKARVDQARASLGKADADVLQAQAKLQQAERDYERAKKLRARDQVSPLEFDNAQATFEIARANLALAESSVALARANLEEASVNLGYTTIRSPVRGVILDRRVNIGQTVVASLNAPSLFLIAKDLGRMEIWASVNESDVGQVHVGQPVHFSVAAFPNEQFHGKVTQIRLNASMSQSVVTYTVVVAVDNSSRKLLPYLTARVHFEVAHRKGVLLVPNAALRWKPPVNLVASEVRDALAAQPHAPRASGAAKRAAPANPPAQGEERPARLWLIDGDLVRPVPIRAGLSDGTSTEIEIEGPGDRLAEGTRVVLGLLQHESDDVGASTPFLPKFERASTNK
jgi:HlyD family secretion protein